MSKKRPFLPPIRTWFRLPEFVDEIYDADIDNSAELLLGFDSDGDPAFVEKSTLGGGGPVPTNTSDLTNDGADGTSTYAETDEISAVGLSGDYSDLLNVPTPITAGQGLTDNAGTFDLGGPITDLIVLSITDPLGNGHGVSIEGNNGAGDEVRFEVTPESVEIEVADVSGNKQSNIGASNTGDFSLNGSSDVSGSLKTAEVKTDHNQEFLEMVYSSDDPGLPQTAMRLFSDEMRVITPLIDQGAATIGHVLTLQASTGRVEFAAAAGAGNTLYSADDSLAGARTVTMGTNQLTWSGTGGDIFMNSGRLGVQQQVFGGSRLGDSEFQAANIDVQTINFKDTGQLTALAMFFTKVPGVGVDGYVTTMKNFVDDVNVISIAGNAAETFGGATRQVESTVGLRNDFSGGEFRVFDFFNNDYDAATDVAEAQGWVAIHGGGATPKKIGLWRYDTTTYTKVFDVNTSNVVDFANAPTQPDASAANESATLGQVPVEVSGTFTPTLVDSSGGATYSFGVVNGTYYKVGKMVHFRVVFGNISTTGIPTGSLRVGNLPFATDNTTIVGVYGANVIFFTGATQNFYSIYPEVVGTNIKFLYKDTLDPDVDFADELPAMVISSGQLAISGVYIEA